MGRGRNAEALGCGGGEEGGRTEEKGGRICGTSVLLDPIPLCHDTPWFCTSKKAGTGPRRPIGKVDALREQKFLYSEVTSSTFGTPVLVAGGKSQVELGCTSLAVSFQTQVTAISP